MGCGGVESVRDLKVIYEDGKAVDVRFASTDPRDNFSFYLQGETETAILGTLTTIDGEHWFRPAIPFTEGQSYEIRNGGKKLAVFTVDKTNTMVQPEILALYPSRDTVPENLLKIYLQFSQPMQQAREALGFITVNDNTTGEEVAVFLELESELWNKEHDRLTLWLDPGRIKTDLIPNKELGLPLLEGHEYSLDISDKWLSAKGKPLARPLRKLLYVGKRDSEKPDLRNWKLIIPAAKTMDPLIIQFGEPMDAVLSLESIQILNIDGQVLEGQFRLSDGESALHFIPATFWKASKYKLHADGKLEDLAGNNLNRLFDTDITRDQDDAAKPVKQQISFEVN
jgi:hypothetical protein